MEDEGDPIAAEPPTGPGAGPGADGGSRRGSRAVAVLFCAPALLIAIALGAWQLLDRAQEPTPLTTPGLPDAPRLTASEPDQVVYRIDPTRSSVGYEAQEILAGQTNTAVGTSRAVAGDVLVDEGEPAESEVGEIVANIEQLTSDQTLRDNRLRHDMLESSHYPLARLTTDSISGLPATIEDGRTYDVDLTGTLVVRDTPKPVSYRASVARDGDDLRVSARIDAKLSDFGAGPISLGPLVQTGNDVTIVVDLVARDVEASPSPSDQLTVAEGPASSFAGAVPSYRTDVEPILETNCATCHTPGESGSSVWTLATAGDAAHAGEGLSLVTSSRYMPPWPASEVGVPLQHERRLSDQDLATITSWTAAGSPLDVDASTPVDVPDDDLEAQFEIREDLLLAPPEAYQGSAALTNDYRCFVYDPKLTADRFVTGVEFRPDRRENAHHALAYRVPAGQLAEMQRLDAADPGGGWQCFAGMAGAGIGELVTGWVPGQRPHKMPDGAGIPMAAGDVFVVQVHYHFPTDPEPDRSQLAVELSDRTDLDRVVTTTYLGPAEIPCAAGETGPLCDRATVIEQLTKDYGPAAAAIPNALLLQCRRTLEEVAVLDGTIASSSCDHRVRRDGEILSVHGHEHEIGRTFRMTLNPGTPDEKVLLDIPHWDFMWQLVYAPQEQITLQRGDVLRIECQWDRSLIKSAQPRYVTWAEGTEDEMCYSTVTVRVPRDPAAGG